jgi:diacylglycerol kinase family enzyme
VAPGLDKPAQHDLPFLVISAGTRNHFALDLGLDRENPAACLNALTDGAETADRLRHHR